MINRHAKINKQMIWSEMLKTIIILYILFND